MFKSKFKMTILFASFLGIFFLLCGGKVSAQAGWNCSPWAPENGSANNNPSQYWGVASGELAHGMAGLRVRAYNANNGQHINIGYELSSELPNGTYNTEPGINKDARIFEWPVGKKGRDNQHWFRTGEHIKFNPPAGQSGSGASYSCNGWSVLGPGNTDECPPPAQRSVPCMYPGGHYAQIGNGWVLDCEEWDSTAGQFKKTNFWISNINNPPGDAGKYGGYWTATYTERGSTRAIGVHEKFSTSNGATSRIDLAWHPNPPPPGGEDDGGHRGRCEELAVNGWGAYDTGVSEPNGAPRWRKTQTLVRVTDANGGVIVPRSGDKKTSNGDFALLEGAPGVPAEDGYWYYKNDLRTDGITIQVIRKWEKRNGTTYFWEDYENNSNTYDCFNAGCSVSVTGNISGRPNGVRSGGPVNIIANATNHTSGSEQPDRLYATIAGRPLTLAITDGLGAGNYFNPAAPNGLPRYGPPSYFVASDSWSVTEPGWGIGTYNVEAKLYYDFDPTPGIQGGDLVIANCAPASYDLYKPFTLDASSEVKLESTLEDPTQATFIGHANTSFYDPYYPNGFNVGFTVDPTQDRYPVGSATHLDGGPKNSSGPIQVPYKLSVNPQPNSAGDKYCMYFDVHQDAGLIGPGNQFAEVSNVPADPPDCEHVHNRPYLHAYGADVIAGSEFRNGDESCSLSGTGQKIDTYRSSTKGGSGAQFAAMALAEISEFRSASVRSPDTNELTFANTTPGDGGLLAGSAVICAQDFYSTLNSGNAASMPVSIGSGALNSQLQPNKQSFVSVGSGTFYINGNNRITKKSALFVEGNVVIRGNITQDFGQYFALIVKGNIYIDNGVTQLDGLYVAQPRDGATGNIYTCAENSTPYATSQLYSSCGTPLRVNGAFVAKSVKFLRTFKSLRDSVANEARNAACSGTPSGVFTCGAEVFHFSPEVYLNTPSFEDATTSQPYDFITTLPPVL